MSICSPILSCLWKFLQDHRRSPSSKPTTSVHQKKSVSCRHTPFGIWPSKHMPKKCKSRDSYPVHNSQLVPQLIQHLFSQKVSCSGSGSLSLPFHPSSSLPSSSTPPLPSPRWSLFSSSHPSTIPFLNASPHISKTPRTAAEGYQWKLLCLILSALSRRITGSIHEVLPSAWTTSPGPDTSVTMYFGFIRDTTRRDTLEWTTESTRYTLTRKDFACFACTWWPNR